MDPLSDNQSTPGHSHACLNILRRHSLDSGIYVNMDIIFDNSLLSTETEETHDYKENHKEQEEIHRTLPDVESKCPTQPSTKPACKPPKKPPRLNNPKKALTQRQQQRKPNVERIQYVDKVGEGNRQQEQSLTKSNESTAKNEETSGVESKQDVCKPLQMVLFTEKDNFGEDGQERRNKDEDINYMNMTENSSPLPTDEPDMAAAGNNASTILAKPGSMVPVPSPPIPPVKPPQLFCALKAALEREKEIRRQEEEQLRNETLKEKDKCEETRRVKSDCRDSEFTPQTEMSSSAYQDVNLPRQGQKRNSLNAADTCEKQTYHELKQTTQKPSTKIKVKIFAMKMICKLKAREEKRRAKARELEMNGEQAHITEVIPVSQEPPNVSKRLDCHAACWSTHM